MKRVHSGDTIFRVIGFIVAMTIAGNSFAQTTYYSRNDAVNLPRQWDDADSWTTNPDGSGSAAAIPQQIDHVVILSGHSIEIGGLTDNGGPSNTPDGLSYSNVGPFVSSGASFFYHKGDISIEPGGKLITAETPTAIRAMFEGTTFVAGEIDAGADILNLGVMFFTATASFSSNDDFILSGNSNTRIDIPNAANAFTNDDIYLDHTDAWLCGLGIIEVDISGSGGIINLNNSATVAQICDRLTIIGCSSGPCAGTGVFNPTPPVLAGAVTDLNYIENAVTQINPTMTLTYGELFLSSATVSLDGTYVNGEDELTMIPVAGISSSFNSGDGTLTLTGYGTISTWETALQNVTYENLSDKPTTSTRVASFEITDGFAASNIETRNIDITPVNDPPDVSTLSGTPTALLYTEGDGAVPVDDEIEVADPDDDDLEGAIITISTAFQVGEDVLAFANTANITGSFVGNVMTLSGTAPIAEYQAALRVVTYENTSEDPNETTRTIGFQVDDGDVVTPIPFTRDIEITAVNDPPVITSTAPTSATEDILYTYTATVADPDDANNGTDIIWTLSNEPLGMVVSTTGVVTWTPLEGVLTSGLVTLSVEDGNEDVSAPNTEDFTITVTPVNDPPVITSTAPTTATEETLYTYTATVLDPDDTNNGTDITWSLSGEPGDMVVSATGVVTWTPAEGVLTSGTVTLSVEDGNEDSSAPDTEDFTITVTPVNDPPVITSVAPTSATEDILYTYTATVADPDDANNGTDIIWTLSNEPLGMVVSTTGVVTWTPLEGVLTSGLVTLSVEDGNEDVSAPDTEDFTITVTPVNDPPVITSTAPTTATEETLYTYTATVLDPDDTNNGTDITWSLSGEPGDMVVSATGVITWTPAEGVLTSGTVTLSVEDGNEDSSAPDTEDFTITVMPVNDPPVINTTAPTTATEDVLYTYNAGATDPDDVNDGVGLIWSLSGTIPGDMAVSNIGVVTWTPAEGVLTSGSITLSVEDGDEDGSSPPDSETFTITVTPVNDPPVITSTAPTTATEETLYTYTATVLDPDDTNNGTDITWSLSGEPGDMVVSATGVVTWTPAEGVLTSGTVTLSVEDGNEDSSAPNTEDFTITVTPVNDPPVITSVAPTSATEDILYTYTATVADPDDANNGTDIIWTLSNEPLGMVVSTTGVVTWTPLEGVLTSGLVTLSVEDGNEDVSAPDTEDFTITVTPVNDPPVITSTAPTTATEETLYTYTATVLDPDDTNNGTDITWSLSGEPGDMVVSATGVVTWTPAEGVLTSGTVTLSVEDGNEDSSAPNTEDFTITVTPVNDPPVITSVAPTSATEDMLYTYTATVADPDDANNGTDIIWTLSNEPLGMVVSTTGVVTWTPLEGVLTSGLVTLSVEDGNEDVSAPDTEDFTIAVTPVNDPPVITSTAPTTATEETLYTYTATVLDPDDTNDGVGLIWSLSGTILGDMAVSNTGVVTWTPAEGVLTSGSITLSVEDGDEDGSSPPDSETFTIAVTPVNDLPMLTSSISSINYTEGDPATAMMTDAAITDGDDSNMEGATIIISANFTTGEDVLAFTPQAGITGSYDALSGILSLSGSASIADYESVIQSVTYENTSNAPVTADRTIDFSVNDGDDDSPLVAITITLTSLPVPPVINPPVGSGQLDYTENEGPKVLEPTFSLSDLDDVNLESATTTIVNVVSTEDVLAFSDQNGITGSFDATAGTLTLTGTATLADYQSAIQSITYENSSDDPSTTIRNVTVVINDGESNSNTLALTINITAVNDPPVIAITSTDLNYLEGSGPVLVDDLITVIDLDNTSLTSATMELGTTFVSSQDVLAFVDQSGISGSFDTSSGVLTLTGTASVADYTAALASVTYENTSINPDVTTRVVSVIANDGTDVSASETRNIIITGTNEPPILVDGNGVPLDTVRFTINEDEVANLCILAADPESNAAHLESITFSSTDGAFDNGTTDDLCFSFTPSADFNGLVYADISICDDGSPVSCSTAVVEITVLPINDAPIAVDDDYSGIEDVDLVGNVLDNDSDPDGDLLIVNTTPVDPPVSGVLALNADGSFTYTPATDFAGSDIFVYSVCDNGDPALCSEAEVTITLTDVEDPVVAYQLLTPNDDAFNDEWVLDGIEQYPQNNVQIFDRWNALVYRSEGYNNMEKVWKGESNEGLSQDELPDGTYFYVIQLGDGSKPLQGFVELKR